MEKRARELLSTLSIRIPSVRIPIASLSGGQRQVVAIARALIGDPKVVILDEPTAALGVEQTAQVLDLVERLRERGLGVILISHNMADVKAVADTVAVLRLGRNNGSFPVKDHQPRRDHRRDHRSHGQRRDPSCGRATRRRQSERHVQDREAGPGEQRHGRPRWPRRRPDRRARSPVVDPRLLVREEGFKGYCTEFKRKIKGGELGSLPVVVGLIIIWTIFQIQNDRFLSAEQPRPTSATIMSATGMLAIGLVFVLLLGEIDLSVGSVSGLASALFAVFAVTHGMNAWLALLLAVADRHRHRRAAGLVLRQDRRAGLRRDPGRLPRLERPDAVAAGLQRHASTSPRRGPGPPARPALLLHGPGHRRRLHAGRPRCRRRCSSATLVEQRRRRKAAGCRSGPPARSLLRVGALAVASFVAAYVLNNASGVPNALVIFLAALVIWTSCCAAPPSAARSSRSAAASRRPAVPVSTCRWSVSPVFAISGGFAAIGGMFFAGQTASATLSAGGGNTLMLAIAAAVIGGTSLFGGRGNVWSALLGMLVIQSIQTGLDLLNMNTSIQYMITGAVLLAAVVIDSVSRRTPEGRGPRLTR